MPAHDLNLAVIDATAGSLSDRGTGSRYATPIANHPLIGHVLAELAHNGVDESRIVAEPDVAAELSRLLGSGERWGVRVSYVEAPKQDGRRTVLRELERALANGPVVLHPGDRLLRGQLTMMRARFTVGDVDSVLPEQATVDGEAEATWHPLSADVVMLGPAMRPVLEDLAVASDPDAGMIDALLHSDCRLAVCEQVDQWRYSDCTAALLAANRMLLDALPEQLAPGGLGEGNEIHGRVAIEPGAWVANCVLHGPISIDSRAVIEDSFIGPYTAIATDAVLSGVEIDNSMVLAGAEIRHPGSRIEASIIGERARVARSFALPRGLHMRLGADSRLTLS